MFESITGLYPTILRKRLWPELGKKDRLDVKIGKNQRQNITMGEKTILKIKLF